MKETIIDLYNYFNITKENNNIKGYLKTYFNENQTIKPGILIIPGGGYQYCSEREAEPIALRYKKFYNVFVLEYTSGVDQIYPTQFLEAAMAMIYIRENFNELLIDQNKVVAVGFSAGGHLCECLGTLFEEEVIIKTFKEKAQFVRPDAVILAYPVITSKEKSHKQSFYNLCRDNQALIRYLSLEERVTEKSSPAFIWHTYNDNVVPVQNSLLLACTYAKNHVPFSLHIFENGKHGLATADLETNSLEVIDNMSSYISHWIEMSISWLKEKNI